MNREQFDHSIRAAGAVLGIDELIVVGSQAVHASMTELPEEAQRSMEVDIVPPDDPDGTRADVIDASIGEASMFHETFGYYSQGVSERTAVLPLGWRDRLCRALLAAHRVDVAVLEERLAEVRGLDDDHRAVVEAFIRSLSSS